MQFVNIIKGEYYNLIEVLKLDWNRYSSAHGGVDRILEKDGCFYYTNSTVRDQYWEIKLHTNLDIKKIIKNIESLSYRNQSLKESNLSNFRNILNTLQRWERQKKLVYLISE